MTEMLERVARAIHAAAGHRTETWEQSPVYRNRYTALARAAIEAMREPTKKMIDTGGACIPEHWAGDNDLAEAWKNMIDVALVGAGAAPGPHDRRPAGAMSGADPREPAIVINRRTLTKAQAMTVRVALESFAMDLKNGLGSDEHGEAMTRAYLACIAEISAIIASEG